MRIAMIAPADSASDVSRLAHDLTAGLHTLPATTVLPLPLTTGRQPREYYTRLAESANAPDVDVVHLHYAPEFFGGLAGRETGYWELRYLIAKPIVLTAHDIRTLEQHLDAASRGIVRRLRNALWLRNDAIQDAVNIAPYHTAFTLVPTAHQRGELLARGAKPGYVAIVPFGIPDVSKDQQVSPPEARGDKDNDRAASRADFVTENGPILCIDDVPADRPGALYGAVRVLAEGRPTLAPDEDVFRDLAGRFDCMELYRAGDDRDRLAHLTRLLADPTRQAVLTANVRKAAVRFAWPRIAAMTRRVYQNAIDVYTSGPHHHA